MAGLVARSAHPSLTGEGATSNSWLKHFSRPLTTRQLESILPLIRQTKTGLVGSAMCNCEGPKILPKIMRVDCPACGRSSALH
jgi:hypothetical protein